MSEDRPQRRGALTVHLAAIATAAAGAWLTSVSPLLAWGALGGALLAYLVLARPQLFALVLIALLPWQGALRFPTHSVTIVKLVGGLLFVSVLLATLVKDRRLRLRAPLGWAVLLCTAITLSLMVNDPGGASVTEALRYWSLALFTFLIVQLVDGEAIFTRALRVLALSTIAGAVWATVQFLDGSVARASGPISDPNDFAYLLAAVVPFVIYLFTIEPRRRWLWGGGLAFIALGILGSSSRGAFVALASTAVWAVCSGRIPTRIVVGALALVATLALLALGISSAKTSQNLKIRQNGLSSSVSLRRVYWSAAWRMSVDHPAFGIGPGRFQAVSPAYVRNTPVLEHEIAVNNTYLSLLAEGGWLALLAFLGFLGAIGRQLRVTRLRRVRAAPPGVNGARDPRADAAHALDSAFRAAFLIAIVGGIFFSAQLSTPFWLIAAFACGLSARAAPAETSERPAISGRLSEAYAPAGGRS